MPQFTEILRSVEEDKFNEIFSASSRQSREAYFHRHGVRAPKKKGLGLVKPGQKNQARLAELYALLKDKEDDEMSEEVLRTWLLTKREMLARALDHLEIPHENGLTESDEVSKFEKLSGKELKKLVEVLSEVAPKTDVAVYLKFMGNEKVDDAMS